MSRPALLRDLVLTLAAHALLAGYRSACAVRETVAIAWDYLTAPASLAEDDLLDEQWTIARAKAEVERAEHAAQLARVDLQRMRETLEEARANASGNLARLSNLLAVIFRDDGARTATFPTLAAAVAEAMRVVAEGHAAREALQHVKASLVDAEATLLHNARDAAQNLSAAQAVIEDLRIGRDRAIDVAMGRQGVIDRIAHRLGARDDETPLQAAERVMHERDEARGALAASDQEVDEGLAAANRRCDVLADDRAVLRRTLTRLREILRAGDHEPIEEAAARLVMFHDGTKEIIAKVRGILGARDGETLVEAAERVRDAIDRGGSVFDALVESMRAAEPDHA